METSKERPGASPAAPDVNQPREILAKLLDIELKRLDTAVRIEGERKIVFPETSVILHDICKLLTAIERIDERAESGGNPGSSIDDPFGLGDIE